MGSEVALGFVKQQVDFGGLMDGLPIEGDAVAFEVYPLVGIFDYFSVNAHAPRADPASGFGARTQPGFRQHSFQRFWRAWRGHPAILKQGCPNVRNPAGKRGEAITYVAWFSRAQARRRAPGTWHYSRWRAAHRPWTDRRGRSDAARGEPGANTPVRRDRRHRPHSDSRFRGLSYPLGAGRPGAGHFAGGYWRRGGGVGRPRLAQCFREAA